MLVTIPAARLTDAALLAMLATATETARQAGQPQWYCREIFGSMV